MRKLGTHEAAGVRIRTDHIGLIREVSCTCCGCPLVVAKATIELVAGECPRVVLTIDRIDLDMVGVIDEVLVEGKGIRVPAPGSRAPCPARIIDHAGRVVRLCDVACPLCHGQQTVGAIP